MAGNLQKHGYDVTKRAVRDKYKAVKEAVQKKNSKELRESGIAPKPTDEVRELTQIVEGLQEVEQEMKDQQGEQQAEEAKKQLDGVKMRQRTLETFSETNRRYLACDFIRHNVYMYKNTFTLCGFARRYFSPATWSMV